MSSRQRAIIIAAMVAIIATALFPPFHVFGPNGVTVNMGYAFLLDPPQYRDGMGATVNVALLVAQWIGCLIVGGMAFLVVHRPSSAGAGATCRRAGA